MKRFRLSPQFHNLWLVERRFMFFFWKPCYESEADMKTGYLDYPLYVDTIEVGKKVIKLIEKHEAQSREKEKRDLDFVKSNKNIYFD